MKDSLATGKILCKKKDETHLRRTEEIKTVESGKKKS